MPPKLTAYLAFSAGKKRYYFLINRKFKYIIQRADSSGLLEDKNYYYYSLGGGKMAKRISTGATLLLCCLAITMSGCSKKSKVSENPKESPAQNEARKGDGAANKGDGAVD